MGMFKWFKGSKKTVETTPETAAQQQAMSAQAASQAAMSAGPTVDAANLQPIAGVSLETFAAVCRELAAHGNDHSKASEIAAGQGIDGESWQQALDGWNARIKAHPGVAEQFNGLYRAG